MRVMWWLLGIVVVAEVGLIAALGPEQTLHVLPWVKAPAALAGACVALYHWRRRRRGTAGWQAVPLLPLGIALLLYAGLLVPGVLGRVPGNVALPIFVAVLFWFLITYWWGLARESGSGSRGEQPNER